MFGQQIITEARARETDFLKAILVGTLTDPEVDDPKAVELASATIRKSLLN